MKWLGMICIFLMSTGIGVYASHKMRTRFLHTQKLNALLADFSSYIRYQCTPLEDLLHLFAKHPNYSEFSFLQNSSARFSAGTPPQIIWHESIAEDPAITPMAKEILYDVGNTLGTTDVEGQLATLELHRKQLEVLASELKENYRMKGELYRRLGMILGIMLAVILL